jgi:hypothetical protein
MNARQGKAKATENFRTVDQRGDDRNKFTTVVGFMSINKMQLDINKIVELWYIVAASREWHSSHGGLSVF